MCRTRPRSSCARGRRNPACKRKQTSPSSTTTGHFATRFGLSGGVRNIPKSPKTSGSSSDTTGTCRQSPANTAPSFHRSQAVIRNSVRGSKITTKTWRLRAGPRFPSRSRPCASISTGSLAPASVLASAPTAIQKRKSFGRPESSHFSGLQRCLRTTCPEK